MTVNTKLFKFYQIKPHKQNHPLPATSLLKAARLLANRIAAINKLQNVKIVWPTAKIKILLFLSYLFPFLTFGDKKKLSTKGESANNVAALPLSSLDHDGGIDNI